MFNVEVLDVFLASRPIGKLFRLANGTASPVIRFVADDDFAQDPNQSTVSISMRASEPAQQLAFWKDITANPFNGTDGRLPSFFQNMLPEGVFRDHLAQERGCRPDDHFSMFAACGLDLPGAIKARPSQNLTRSELQRLVHQARLVEQLHAGRVQLQFKPASTISESDDTPDACVRLVGTKV